MEKVHKSIIEKKNNKFETVKNNNVPKYNIDIIQLNKIVELKDVNLQFYDQNIIFYKDSIYLFDALSKKIKLFDASGRLINSFGQIGIGPGEYSLGISSLFFLNDTLCARPNGQLHTIMYNKEGKFYKNRVHNDQIVALYLSGKILKMGDKILSIKDYMFSNEATVCLSMFDNNLDFKKLLYEKKIRVKARMDPTDYSMLACTASSYNYYIAKTSDNEFSINQYDYDNNMVRKIENNYKKVKLKLSDRLLYNLSKYNVKYLKAIQEMYTDKYENLWVITSEAKQYGEFKIFSKEGIFLYDLKLNKMFKDSKKLISIFPKGDKIVAVFNDSSIIIYDYHI
jgi:hypothetical protein